MQPYLGQIMLFAGNFIPVGYLPCDGSLQSIAENDALYNLLGTTYGGDGMTTFGMPDLRGRAPQHFGTGPGLKSYTLGQMSGSETVTLTTAQMPAHNHVLTATVAPACNNGDEESSDNPVGNYLRRFPGTNTYSANMNGQTGQSDPFTIPMMPQGGSQPMDICQPSLVMTFCICSSGIYPSQS
ncbi:phage tail protein [Flavobacterium pallidum]|uniref:Phage tail protein n=1 Tax=Flavobacterium pallidum TaxID=2172098 RepID=A0A2S1SH97_9FLAO|nr:tail fiber protein [Flavobacterium pallidum]AWI25770.1 phage tail protein [Flavobacterium pallidum]